MQASLSSRRATIWRPGSRLALGTAPEHFRHWLVDASSLTRRVVAACGGAFRVQLLAQRWERPRPDESDRLGMRAGALAWVRQVRLMCEERPWVYARTVIPRTTLTGAERRLGRLGSRPLGAALFADPTMERGAVEITRLDSSQSMFALAVGDLITAPKEIWGRRSVFRLSGKPLLVSEFFLPEIPSQIAPQTSGAPCCP